MNSVQYPPPLTNKSPKPCISLLQPQFEVYKENLETGEETIKMIIQQQARIKKQEQEIQVRLILLIIHLLKIQCCQPAQQDEHDNLVRRRKESEIKILVKKMRGRARNKIEPVSLAPRTIEEAPLRRMDRRALNALRKRRADKHMIAFLVIIGILIVAAGISSIIVWEIFR